jgi:uncharacterized protein YdhG (YjbR/CyaY superfamily)
MATKRMEKFDCVDDYILSHHKDVQVYLKKIRSIVLKCAPKTEETISYGMPAYKLNGVLVYFAAFKKHYSLFALPKTNITLKNELKPYKTSKGTIQFAYDKPLPVALITKIVKMRVKENLEKEALKNAEKRTKKK